MHIEQKKAVKTRKTNRYQRSENTERGCHVTLQKLCFHHPNKVTEAKSFRNLHLGQTFQNWLVSVTETLIYVWITFQNRIKIVSSCKIHAMKVVVSITGDTDSVYSQRQSDT